MDFSNEIGSILSISYNQIAKKKLKHKWFRVKGGESKNLNQMHLGLLTTRESE